MNVKGCESMIYIYIYHTYIYIYIYKYDKYDMKYIYIYIYNFPNTSRNYIMTRFSTRLNGTRLHISLPTELSAEI